jgi:hypothetical protein
MTAGEGPVPQEYLDDRTAATVSVVAKPLVFARERRELAAHARDYVTVAACSVNRSGAVDYFFLVYFWSTLDRRDRPGGRDLPAPEDLTIAADDRLIRLKLLGHQPQEAGVGSALHSPPHRHWTLNVYRTDLATLRFLSAAGHIAVVTDSTEGAVTYEPWGDDQRSLRGLVARLYDGA